MLFCGSGIGDGCELGRLYFTKKKKFAAREYMGAEAELAAFSDAKDAVEGLLLRRMRRAEQSVGAREAEIFEIHRMLLNDEELLDGVRLAIGDGRDAVSAVLEVSERMADVFDRMEDEYLKARAADMRDIGTALAEALSGGPRREEDYRDAIIVADDLTPGETVGLDPSRVRGFVTFRGSKTSHTAILARAMGIPALVAVGNIPEEYDTHEALIDAASGTLCIDPGGPEREALAYRKREESEKRARLLALAGMPAVTRSGKRIKVMANLGAPSELRAALEGGCDGVGLFRSEFLFIGRSEAPDEEEQFEAYRDVARGLSGRRLIIRTLDIGADKQVAYIKHEPEENPALGVRGIRLCLSNSELFRVHLRAILRASAYGRVSLMLPMVVSCDEIRRTRSMISGVMSELRRQGEDFDPNIEVGVMLETPAAAVMAGELARFADFFSVGTNDLCQYTLAADRQNPELSALIEENYEPVFRLIRDAAERIHASGKWIGVCGEMAADARFAERFAAIGVDELSLSPRYIAGIKERIREIK